MAPEREYHRILCRAIERALRPIAPLTRDALGKVTEAWITCDLDLWVSTVVVTMAWHREGARPGDEIARLACRLSYAAVCELQDADPGPWQPSAAELDAVIDATIKDAIAGGVGYVPGYVSPIAAAHTDEARIAALCAHPRLRWLAAEFERALANPPG